MIVPSSACVLKWRLSTKLSQEHPAGSDTQARVCGHSLEGEECADEMDGGGEADVGFVIAGGDATELLGIAEEVLDQVAPAIDREVAGDRADAVGLGRDDGRRPSVVQVGADPVDVESLVGDQGVELDTGDQRLDADTVVALARQQDKAGQIAQGIDQGHDLGCQAAARPADGLSVGPPLT